MRRGLRDRVLGKIIFKGLVEDKDILKEYLER